MTRAEIAIGLRSSAQATLRSPRRDCNCKQSENRASSRRDLTDPFGSGRGRFHRQIKPKTANPRASGPTSHPTAGRPLPANQVPEPNAEDRLANTRSRSCLGGTAGKPDEMRAKATVFNGTAFCYVCAPARRARWTWLPACESSRACEGRTFFACALVCRRRGTTAGAGRRGTAAVDGPRGGASVGSGMQWLSELPFGDNKVLQIAVLACCGARGPDRSGDRIPAGLRASPACSGRSHAPAAAWAWSTLSASTASGSSCSSGATISSIW